MLSYSHDVRAGVTYMYIERPKKKVKDKVYSTVLLRESYRENGKVKHRTIANLTKWSTEAIAGLEAGLKGKTITSVNEMQFGQGKSIGAIAVIKKVADELGITRALGYSNQGKLALIQIASRLISQGSRRYTANEWIHLHELTSVFGKFDLSGKALYNNLDWLSEHQAKIEQKIFKNLHTENSCNTIFLYDVTSSYLEGNCNELAAYGYNRDKKKGKKQIVIGLLTDDNGYPVSVEVFKGNTQDPKTVSSQLQKLRDRFNAKQVVMIGDKGMIKTQQIEELEDNFKAWGYLTTITKAQINSLIKTGFFQLSFFEEQMLEIQDETGTRYILRKNPVRAIEIAKNRLEKIIKCENKLVEKNKYLQEHPKAKVEVATRNLNNLFKKLKVSGICSVEAEGRVLSFIRDEEKFEEAEKLDGCSVVKTNVSPKMLDMRHAHDRYKDLAKVESAFRTMKTTLEEIRPLHVQLETRTRGHVFICSLAYMIAKYIRDKTKKLNLTLKFIFETLVSIHTLTYTWKGDKEKIIPNEFSSSQQSILDCLDIKLKP